MQRYSDISPGEVFFQGIHHKNIILLSLLQKAQDEEVSPATFHEIKCP